MELKLSFSMLLLLVLLSACKKEKVGGDCEYETVHKKVSVTFIDGELEGEFMVSFQPAGVETDEVYRVNKKQFKSVLRNFDLDALKNKDHIFVLKIDEIIKGTCTPFEITEIHLE